MRIGVGELVQAAAVGVGATIVMDGVAEMLRRTRGSKSLDYAMVGRWLGHMPAGVFRHDSIMAADPVPHEKELGWAAHYAIGTGFAVALAAADPGWLERPRFIPAVAWGLATLGGALAAHAALFRDGRGGGQDPQSQASTARQPARPHFLRSGHLAVRAARPRGCASPRLSWPPPSQRGGFSALGVPAG